MDSTFFTKRTPILTTSKHRLSLPFTRQEYRLLWNIQMVLGCLLIGSIIFIGWCWKNYHEVANLIAVESDALEKIRNDNEQFQEKMVHDGLTLSPSQIEHIKNRIVFVNQLHKKKTFSWAKLLHNLSEALPAQVSIQSVRLRFQDSTILLKGKVKTLRDLNALVRNLESHDAFRSVKVSNHRFEDMKEKGNSSLTNQRSVSQAKSHTVVQFQLSVAYRPLF